MKQIAIGLLAHVDAGKTTLSEAMLYNSGSIRRLGRVDDRDAFLDTHELERTRGITIFSKQAVLEYGDWRVTLLDTPGHVDSAGFGRGRSDYRRLRRGAGTYKDFMEAVEKAWTAGFPVCQ